MKERAQKRERKRKQVEGLHTHTHTHTNQLRLNLIKHASRRSSCSLRRVALAFLRLNECKRYSATKKRPHLTNHPRSWSACANLTADSSMLFSIVSCSKTGTQRCASSICHNWITFNESSWHWQTRQILADLAHCCEVIQELFERLIRFDMHHQLVKPLYRWSRIHEEVKEGERLLMSSLLTIDADCSLDSIK